MDEPLADACRLVGEFHSIPSRDSLESVNAINGKLMLRMRRIGGTGTLGLRSVSEPARLRLRWVHSTCLKSRVSATKNANPVVDYKIENNFRESRVSWGSSAGSLLIQFCAMLSRTLATASSHLFHAAIRNPARRFGTRPRWLAYRKSSRVSRLDKKGTDFAVIAASR